MAFAMANNSNPSAMATAACRISAAEIEGAAVGVMVDGDAVGVMVDGDAVGSLVGLAVGPARMDSDILRSNELSLYHNQQPF